MDSYRLGLFGDGATEAAHAQALHGRAQSEHEPVCLFHHSGGSAIRRRQGRRRRRRQGGGWRRAAAPAARAVPSPVRRIAFGLGDSSGIAGSGRKSGGGVARLVLHVAHGRRLWLDFGSSVRRLCHCKFVRIRTSSLPSARITIHLRKSE